MPKTNKKLINDSKKYLKNHGGYIALLGAAGVLLIGLHVSDSYTTASISRSPRHVVRMHRSSSSKKQTARKPVRVVTTDQEFRPAAPELPLDSFPAFGTAVFPVT